MLRGSCLIALLTVLLAACSQYRVERPSTAAGQVCAAQCDAEQAQCYSQAQSAADSAAGTCSARQDRIDDHCNNYTQSKDRSHCQAVNQASHGCVTAAPSANTAPCESTWRQCVLGCGGRLIDR